MNDKDAWSNNTPVEPEAKNINIGWPNLLLRIFAGFVIYSIFSHIYIPAPLPQGNIPIINEIIISTFTYALDFFVVYFIFAFLFTAVGKAIPKFRKISIPSLLNKALIASLIIDGIFIYGGYYAINYS